SSSPHISTHSTWFVTWWVKINLSSLPQRPPGKHLTADRDRLAGVAQVVALFVWVFDGIVAADDQRAVAKDHRLFQDEPVRNIQHVDAFCLDGSALDIHKDQIPVFDGGLHAMAVAR